MKYNPQNTGGDKSRHNKHRRSIRLKGYDYSQAAAYFITLCCQDRKCRFGKIVGASPAEMQMELNRYGTTAYNEWIKLTERFLNFELGDFQIMPNHMHGIILLTEPAVGATLAVAQNDTVAQNHPVAQNDTVARSKPESINELKLENMPSTIQGAGVNPTPTNTTTTASVGDIVGAYKSLVANACLEIFKSKNETMGKFWQRNYYEHIIRDEQSYQRISNYITNNPSNWDNDKFYTQ